jgi:CheY-like chemotaxis protein
VSGFLRETFVSASDSWSRRSGGLVWWNPVRVATSGSGTRRRILIVDDDEDVIELSGEWLRVAGHDCRGASAGREALALMEGFEPDIAIIDLGLPDISGHDVARALRSRARTPLYLVALTGWARPRDRAEALAAGFDRFVVKPGQLERIVQLAEERLCTGC